MKKRLTLRSERLVELGTDELRSAKGAAADGYTGNPVCALSLANPCVSNVCVGRPLYTITEAPTRTIG